MMDRHTDGAKAVPIDQRKENGRITYSSLSPGPPIEQRLQYIAPIFGGIMVTLLAIMGVIYARLVRSKRIFEAGTGNVRKRRRRWRVDGSARER